MLITAILGACDRPLEPLEVNDENCKWEVISQWAEENNLSKEQIKEFQRKCFRRSRGTFERSEDKVWKFGKD